MTPLNWCVRSVVNKEAWDKLYNDETYRSLLLDILERLENLKNDNGERNAFVWIVDNHFEDVRRAYFSLIDRVKFIP